MSVRRLRAYRLELYLPANSDVERAIVREAVARLRERYGGATHSSLADRGAFAGEYEEGRGMTRDQVAYVFADSIERRETRASAGVFLDTLLERLALAYRDAGVPQEAVMATLYPVDVHLKLAESGGD